MGITVSVGVHLGVYIDTNERRPRFHAGLRAKCESGPGTKDKAALLKNNAAFFFALTRPEMS
jgi:hypothetical protein